MAAKTAKKRPVRFKDRLSCMTYYQACQLLGEEAQQHIALGIKSFKPIELDKHVYLGNDLLRVNLISNHPDSEDATVVLTQSIERKRDLVLNCDRCETHCAHMGAAIQFLLEEKSLMGLAAPPDESVPFELLTREELIERALDERRQRAELERMRLKAINPSTRGENIY